MQPLAIQHDWRMDKWQTAEWLGFIAIVVAVLFGIGAIWAARRFGTRRGKVLVGAAATPLLASIGSQGNYLEVTYKDRAVEDPHLVRFLVTNVGPHDITRDQFDEGKLFIKLQTGTLYGIVSVGSTDGVSPQVQALAINEEGDISIDAMLLPKGTTWVFEFIVAGPGQPNLRGRLINTDIVVGEITSTGFLQTYSTGFLLGLLDAVLPFPILVRNRR